MANSKEIIRRIKATKNIAKITKAMELVSAAKMRKAQGAATSSRPYARLSTALLQGLVGRAEHNHPLLNRPAPESKLVATPKTLAVLITSDKGLAGALNTNILNRTIKLIRENETTEFDFIAVGKKGTDALRRMRKEIVAAFPSKDKNINILDAKPIAEVAINDYLAFKYDKVFVIYTDFVSTLVQKPNIVQLLPLATPQETEDQDLLIEPNPDDVLENIIYRSIEFTVFQAMVEAVASEHSARMVAMRNANEAAGDLIEDLTLTYNQARQAGITRELAEISAAKLAMEG